MAKTGEVPALPATGNGANRPTAAVQKKRARTMDPCLRLAAKLDWLMQEIPVEYHPWALDWLRHKYGAKAPACNAPPLG